MWSSSVAPAHAMCALPVVSARWKAGVWRALRRHPIPTNTCSHVGARRRGSRARVRRAGAKTTDERLPERRSGDCRGVRAHRCDSCADAAHDPWSLQSLGVGLALGRASWFLRAARDHSAGEPVLLAPWIKDILLGRLACRSGRLGRHPFVAAVSSRAPLCSGGTVKPSQPQRRVGSADRRER
jgi:hypothetical protein